jgi:hypothetical protein
MSRICIVVGMEDGKSSSPLSLVYLGRSGEEMRRAVEQATSPRLLVIPFATGYTKSNPRAVANAAAAAAAAATEPAATEPAATEPAATEPAAPPARARKR